MSDESPRCTAWTRSGLRCTHNRNLQNGLCIWHDPERAEQASAMRRNGQAAGVKARDAMRRERLALLGKTAGPRPDVGDDLDSIGKWLRWCLTAAALGEITTGQLMAFTAGARVLQGVYEKTALERALKVARKELAAFKKRMTP